MFASSWILGSSTFSLHSCRFFCFRVDPTAVLQNEMPPPMEIAVRMGGDKSMLKILLEYAEMPDDVKLVQLSELMSSARAAAADMEEDEEKAFKEEFQKILRSLSSSVELVRH